MSNFKKSKPENVRITESSKIIEKYPERIPVIVEKSSRSKVQKFKIQNSRSKVQKLKIQNSRSKVQ